MARFAVNQTVVTTEPVVVVDAGLPIGSHRFRLVVSDERGNVSRPDEVVVQVSLVNRPPVRPPVLSPTRPPTRPPASQPASRPASQPGKPTRGPR